MIYPNRRKEWQRQRERERESKNEEGRERERDNLMLEPTYESALKQCG